jgi:hypothetical protein
MKDQMAMDRNHGLLFFLFKKKKKKNGLLLLFSGRARRSGPQRPAVERESCQVFCVTRAGGEELHADQCQVLRTAPQAGVERKEAPMWFARFNSQSNVMHHISFKWQHPT